MSPRMLLPLAWAAALVLAWPYVMRTRHPESRPLAAYLIFVTVLSMTAAVLFGMLTSLLVGIGAADRLEQPFLALLLLILVFAPGFFLARALIRRPPRRPPLPGG